MSFFPQILRDEDIGIVEYFKNKDKKTEVLNMDKRIIVGVYEFEYIDEDFTLFIGGFGKFKVLPVGNDEWKVLIDVMEGMNLYLETDQFISNPGDDEYNKLWNILHDTY